MQKYLTRKLIASLFVFFCSVSFGSFSTFFAPEVAHAAAPLCAVLDQGETACPGGTNFTGKDGECFYYDPGNPQGGTLTGFPGWQKADCSADIFKEALCVAGKVAQNPQCATIGESQDPALSNKCPQTSGSTASDCDLTTRYIDPLINALAALVAVVVTASIIYGGIQYASSAGDPQKVSQAKSRIMNSLIALVAFFFLYAFLQWLIPGGFL